MESSQIRATARESLRGKWGKAALLSLTYGIIVWVIEFVCSIIPIIGPIVLFIISTPISYGLIVSFMKLKRGEKVGYVDFLSHGFASFGNVWRVVGNTLIKMILPFIIFIIFTILGIALFINAILLADCSGGIAGLEILEFISVIGYIFSLIYVIIKGYLYSLSNCILHDNPNMPAKEIVEQSAKLMLGNRWRLFWLTLTFIGWAILATFTFGIGYLWLFPYIMVSQICFYEDLANKNDNGPIAEN